MIAAEERGGRGGEVESWTRIVFSAAEKFRHGSRSKGDLICDFSWSIPSPSFPSSPLPSVGSSDPKRSLIRES